MKLIVREHRNIIAEPKKTVYKVYVDVVNSYNKIPAGIGLMKGDLIVFRGEGDPVRFSSGNVNGKTLVTDNTSPTGWVLGDAGGGGGGTVPLYNDTGAQIIAGTVVYGEPSSDPNNPMLLMRKATATTSGQLYVLRDDCANGKDAECYCIAGTVATVLCDSGAVSQGDALIVSGSGLCAALAGGTPTVGIALSDKALGTVGPVKCVLTRNNTTEAVNNSSTSTLHGTVYRLESGGNDGEPLAIPAEKGKQPYGVQGNAQSNSLSSLLLHHHPGEEAVVRADTTEIQVGDWLVPSATTAGMVRSGNGYGIGYALEAKAEGETGLVRCLLMPGQYGISPRCWYLPSGITEDQVLAAYQFVGRASEAEALININNGTEYPLTKQGSVIWNADSGFYIPATAGAGLDNTEIRAARSNINAGAFGYAEASMANGRTIGGILLYNHMSLFLQGYGTGSVYMNYPSINKGKSTVTTNRAATKKSEGVLAGHFNNGEIYLDGEILSLTDGTSYSNTSYTFYQRVIGQSTQESPDYNSFYVTALVLFTTTLNAEQHLELSQNIHHLGGIDI